MRIQYFFDYVISTNRKLEFIFWIFGKSIILFFFKPQDKRNLLERRLMQELVDSPCCGSRHNPIFWALILVPTELRPIPLRSHYFQTGHSFQKHEWQPLAYMMFTMCFDVIIFSHVNNNWIPSNLFQIS